MSSASDPTEMSWFHLSHIFHVFYVRRGGRLHWHGTIGLDGIDDLRAVSGEIDAQDASDDAGRVRLEIMSLAFGPPPFEPGLGIPAIMIDVP